MKGGYKVNEIFTSVQGEGLLVGRPSTFIRLQGCPVGCSWCDSGPLADEIEGKRRTNGTTANTWGPGGEWMSVEEIGKQVETHHVIITGGEPVIWNLDLLIRQIRSNDELSYIQLETSGLNALKGVEIPDWVTWSPKQNLDWQAPMSLKNLVREVKFVVDKYLSITAVQKVVDYYHYEISGGLLREFVLMPEGCPPTPETIGHTLDLINGPDVDWHNFPVRMGLRAQYYLNMR